MTNKRKDDSWKEEQKAESMEQKVGQLEERTEGRTNGRKDKESGQLEESTKGSPNRIESRTIRKKDIQKDNWNEGQKVG